MFARIVNLFNKEDSDVILSRYSVEDLPSLERFANNLEETVKMAHEM